MRSQCTSDLGGRRLVSETRQPGYLSLTSAEPTMAGLWSRSSTQAEGLVSFRLSTMAWQMR
uniref:Uncharacterized protein n=1 Tax=Arundo donax TaxID=35708 RepID=A0A0A9A827_ARUDO